MQDKLSDIVWTKLNGFEQQIDSIQRHCTAYTPEKRLERSERELELRITIPETLNFSEAFEDLFSQYTKRHELASVKTSNMGSLYKLLYKIELKDSGTSKEFIDQLRCRNGNLEITLADTSERNEEL